MAFFLFDFPGPVASFQTCPQHVHLLVCSVISPNSAVRIKNTETTATRNATKILLVSKHACAPHDVVVYFSQPWSNTKTAGLFAVVFPTALHKFPLLAPIVLYCTVRHRYDKLPREVREKEDILNKTRLDLKAELEAAGGSSSRSTSAPSPPSLFFSNSTDNASTSGESTPNGGKMSTPVSSSGDLTASDSTTTGVGANPPPTGTPGGVRRDGPWMLESLGLGHQVSSRSTVPTVRMPNTK